VPLGLASDQVVSIRDFCSACISNSGSNLAAFAFSLEVTRMKFLKAVAVLGFGVAAAQDDACHSSHKAKADCDADAKCTWCEASAVPSACYTKENAAKLPPAVFTCATHGRRHPSELLPRAEVEKLGVAWCGNATHRSSHELLDAAEYPSDFSWCNKDGKSYCTMSRNQHIPQYCGSCWAHGAISALGDRIKIARNAQGIDINLAVQHLLNCGGVGTCKGGSVDGPYQWLMEISKKGTGISYETANPYVACSSDSDEGFCKHVDTSCKALNVARTCGSFSQEGGPCTGLGEFPNATISDYGSISGADAMMKEIFHRGPISCGVDANPLLNYESGIIKTKGEGVDHVVSVVGWGTDSEDGMYWIVRNSWGEYWGEMGYFRVAKGALLLEELFAVAVLQFQSSVFPLGICRHLPLVGPLAIAHSLARSCVHVFFSAAPKVRARVLRVPPSILCKPNQSCGQLSISKGTGLVHAEHLFRIQSPGSKIWNPKNWRSLCTLQTVRWTKFETRQHKHTAKLCNMNQCWDGILEHMPETASLDVRMT
ncbi:Ctsz, partial [Symbiodinium necroappetens]